MSQQQIKYFETAIRKYRQVKAEFCRIYDSFILEAQKKLEALRNEYKHSKHRFR